MQRATILLVLASCASDPSTEPLDDADAERIATSIAATLRPVAGGGELGAMLDAAELVRGAMPVGFANDNGTVRGQHAGFAFAYGPMCRDANNRAIACDNHTDNADIDVTWSGVLASRGLTTVSSREGAWILNDITAERLRLDGDSHFEYAMRVTKTDESHELAYDASYRGIILVRGERYPRAGLVRYALWVDDERELRAEARFHASGLATIVLPDHELTLDLTTGNVYPAP